jgi:hypothetical protein
VRTSVLFMCLSLIMGCGVINEHAGHDHTTIIAALRAADRGDAVVYYHDGKQQVRLVVQVRPGAVLRTYGMIEEGPDDFYLENLVNSHARIVKSASDEYDQVIGDWVRSWFELPTRHGSPADMPENEKEGK